MMLTFLNLYYWIFVYVYFRSSRLVDEMKYDKAITILINWMEKKKFVTEALYYELGRAYLGKKEYSLAIESFSLCLKYNESQNIFKANTYFYLGLTYFDSERFKLAIKNFINSIHIKQKLRFNQNIVVSVAHLYCYIGRAYAKLDNKQEAFRFFNEGLKFEPNNEALHRELTLLGAG